MTPDHQQRAWSEPFSRFAASMILEGADGDMGER